MEKYNKKCEKGTLGWLREQQNIKAKNDGFDNIDDWLKWRNRSIEEKYGKEFAEWARKNPGSNWKNKKNQIKREKEWKDSLKDRYGKEFADWAIQNKNEVPNKYLVLGCKTELEYRDKIAQKLGFKDRIEHSNYKAKTNGYKDDADRRTTSNHERGVCFPIYDNEDYPQYLGTYLGERKYAKKILPIILGKIKKEMPINYPEYDFIVEKDMESITVDVKSIRLSIKHMHWNFPIRHNSGADYFLFLAFNERKHEEEIKLLHIFLIKNDEEVRKCSGNGYKMEILCDREGISISNDHNSVMYFEYFRRYDHIANQKIKECIDQIDKESMNSNNQLGDDNTCQKKIQQLY